MRSALTAVVGNATETDAASAETQTDQVDDPPFRKSAAGIFSPRERNRGDGRQGAKDLVISPGNDVSAGIFPSG